MNAIVEIHKPAGALASTQASGRMALAEIIQHVALVQEVMRNVMKPDVHYGQIPGTDKPTLYKSGAELLCMVFRIAQSYEVTDLSTPDAVRYQSVCVGTHQISGLVLGSGMGEASSSEAKYKWRKAFQSEWDATPEASRRKYQAYNKSTRQKYDVLQVRTEPADLANTILKMANKRAMLAMVLNVTAASDCFTQDLEDMDEKLRDHLARNGDQEHGAQAPAAEPQKPAFYQQDQFDKNLPAWRNVIESGRKTPEQIIAMAQSKHPLTDEQKAAVHALASKPAAAADQSDQKPVITYAQVAEAMVKATTLDALNDAWTLIGDVSDPEQRKELSAMFDKRSEELQGQ